MVDSTSVEKRTAGGRRPLFVGNEECVVCPTCSTSFRTVAVEKIFLGRIGRVAPPKAWVVLARQELVRIAIAHAPLVAQVTLHEGGVSRERRCG